MNRSCRGFTLIEIMVVVAIIAILGSVAMPTFQRTVVRTKAAERAAIMLRVKQAIQDHYLRTGSAGPEGAVVVSGWNPPLPAQNLKRAMSTADPVWNTYFSVFGGGSSLPVEVEGGVYYSYLFIITEINGASTIDVISAGDLDGDGIASVKHLQWTRNAGVYQQSFENPLPGQEDALTF